jgi:hypothetical protein
MCTSENNFKGYLKGFPSNIVNRMLEEQVKQGNEACVNVFEENLMADKENHGFTWADTKEGEKFWDRVIAERNFNEFFDKELLTI